MIRVFYSITGEVYDNKAPLMHSGVYVYGSDAKDHGT